MENVLKFNSAVNVTNKEKISLEKEWDDCLSSSKSTIDLWKLRTMALENGCVSPDIRKLAWLYLLSIPDDIPSKSAVSINSCSSTNHESVPSLKYFIKSASKNVVWNITEQIQQNQQTRAGRNLPSTSTSPNLPSSSSSSTASSPSPSTTPVLACASESSTPTSDTPQTTAQRRVSFAWSTTILSTTDGINNDDYTIHTLSSMDSLSTIRTSVTALKRPHLSKFELQVLGRILLQTSIMNSLIKNNDKIANDTNESLLLFQDAKMEMNGNDDSNNVNSNPVKNEKDEVKTLYRHIPNIAAVLVMNLESPSLTCLALNKLLQYQYHYYSQSIRLVMTLFQKVCSLEHYYQSIATLLQERLHHDNKNCCVNNQDNARFIIQTWIQTWFTKDIPKFSIISRLMDVFLVSHPWCPIYMVVALLQISFRYMENNDSLTTIRVDWLKRLPLKIAQSDINDCEQEVSVKTQEAIPDIVQKWISLALEYMNKVPPSELALLCREKSLKCSKKNSIPVIVEPPPPPTWLIKSSTHPMGMLQHSDCSKNNDITCTAMTPPPHNVLISNPTACTALGISAQPKGFRDVESRGGLFPKSVNMISFKKRQQAYKYLIILLVIASVLVVRLREIFLIESNDMPSHSLPQPILPNLEASNIETLEAPASSSPNNNTTDKYGDNNCSTKGESTPLPELEWIHLWPKKAKQENDEQQQQVKVRNEKQFIQDEKGNHYFKQSSKKYLPPKELDKRSTLTTDHPSSNNEPQNKDFDRSIQKRKIMHKRNPIKLLWSRICKLFQEKFQKKKKSWNKDISTTS